MKPAMSQSDKIEGLAQTSSHGCYGIKSGGSPVLVSAFPCSWKASPFLFRAQIHKELRSSPKIQLGINICAARKQIMVPGPCMPQDFISRVEAHVGGAFGGTAAMPPKLYIAAE